MKSVPSVSKCFQVFPIVKRVVCLNRVDDCCVVILFDDPENANGKLLLESKKEKKCVPVAFQVLTKTMQLRCVFSEPDGLGFGRQ